MTREKSADQALFDELLSRGARPKPPPLEPDEGSTLFGFPSEYSPAPPSPIHATALRRLWQEQQRSLPSTTRIKDDEYLIDSGGDVAPQAIHQACFQPNTPFRITGVDCGEDFDVEYAQVGNTLLTAFAKRYPTADIAVRITLHFRNVSRAPARLQAKVKGIALIP